MSTTTAEKDVGSAPAEGKITPEAISLFIVELPNPGVTMTKLRKEGIRGSETALIHFDDVRVADDALLGAREGTYPVILDSLAENRVGVAANALGMARAAFEAASRYANDRLVAGKRIGDYQAIGHKLADMAADIEAYGQWMRDDAFKRIGHLYPDATGPGGEKLTPIAWIWARTVDSPDPTWNGHVPLVASWTLAARAERRFMAELQTQRRQG